MIITLPRGRNIDINNIPENLEELIRKDFSEYTEGTRPEYMFEDKLCYIDLMAKKLHKADAEDKVNRWILENFKYELEENDYFMEESDFLSRSSLMDCYEMGVRDSSLYFHDWQTWSKHVDEKIMRIECRAIKAVMSYAEGNDGL